MLNQTHSCNIDVATLFGVNLISNKMSCYLKLSSCNIHDTTPFNVNINSNKMLCCLKFISCNKNDAALLNVNFISYQMSLVRQLGAYFFKKKCPENHNSNGPKWKKAGPPANTNNVKTLKSWLSQTNTPNLGFEVLHHFDPFWTMCKLLRVAIGASTLFCHVCFLFDFFLNFSSRPLLFPSISVYIVFHGRIFFAARQEITLTNQIAHGKPSYTASRRQHQKIAQQLRWATPGCKTLALDRQRKTTDRRASNALSNRMCGSDTLFTTRSDPMQKMLKNRPMRMISVKEFCMDPTKLYLSHVWASDTHKLLTRW